MRAASPEIEAAVAQLDGLTVGAALRRSARLYASLPFLKCEGRISSFAQTDAEVDRLADSLLGLGLKRGDHLGVWLTNSREWVLCFFACARIGVVVVPINTRYTAAEAGYILSQSDAKAVVMTRRMWGNDYLSMLAQIAPGIADATERQLSLPELPMLKHVICVGPDAPACGISFESMCETPATDALGAAESAVEVSDPLIIVYTSGTTGKPKGAMHNHRVIKQATRVGLMLGLEPGGRSLGHLPLYHVAGLYMAMVPAMTLGGCYVAMPQWDTAAALDLIEHERISCFGGIPTHFVDLANHPSLPGRDLSHLKRAWIGGAPVMQSTFRGFMQAMGLQHLMSTYGMTENTISTTFNRPDDPVEVCCLNLAPVLGPSEIRIIDPGSGAELAAGETGEIQCRGETVMMGYYKNPVATDETITPEGWLRTGDLGCIDAQGYISISGRLKEMYKSGGTNVYPVEIEQHLVRHPAVLIAAVVGVPDERLGEVGFAFVQLNEGRTLDHAELRAHCKGTLADYKVPRYLSLVSELPRTSTGKIQRSALLDMARKELEASGRLTPSR